ETLFGISRDRRVAWCRIARSLSRQLCRILGGVAEHLVFRVRTAVDFLSRYISHQIPGRVLAGCAGHHCAIWLLLGARHQARVFGAEPGKAVPRTQTNRIGRHARCFVYRRHVCRYAGALGVYRSAIHYIAVSSRTVNSALNWDEIKLVVIDVDGTLYDQRGLR